MNRHIVMMKLPITSAHGCSLLNHPNSFHRGMFKLNVKFDSDLFLYSLSHLKVTATQYTRSFNGV